MGNSISTASPHSSLPKLGAAGSKRSSPALERSKGKERNVKKTPQAPASLDPLDIYSLLIHAASSYGPRLAVVDCGVDPNAARTFSYAQLVRLRYQGRQALVF